MRGIACPRGQQRHPRLGLQGVLEPRTRIRPVRTTRASLKHLMAQESIPARSWRYGRGMTDPLMGDTGGDDVAAGGSRTKLLTFQTWVFRVGWYRYALDHPDLVPFLLTDRSPCQDPFFDPFEAPERRRPLISGLCRVLKNFEVGDRFIYVAHVEPGVARRLELDTEASNYFAVAALRVKRVWESHREAAAAFMSRRYVPSPAPTPHPPNLAFARQPEAAAARGCCITFDESTKPPRAHLPDTADEQMWRRHYLAYHVRQKDNSLRAAECDFETVDGSQCLQLQPAEAAVVTPDWWLDQLPAGVERANVYGVDLSEERAQQFRTAIAAGRTGSA